MKKFMTVLIVAALLMTTFALSINAAVAEEKSKIEVNPEKIEKIDTNYNVELIYPVFSGFSAAEKLNNIIRNRNIENIGFINGEKTSLLEMKEKNPEFELSNIKLELNQSYDYSISGDILSVILTDYMYLGGAHGTTNIVSYTVDTKTGEIYTLKSLFNQDSNYKKYILDKINSMIDKESDLYFEDAKENLAKKNTDDFQFYIDGNNLVIYFGLYDLRPYAGGIPEFSISAAELKGLLKDEVYTGIINGKPLSDIRMNGTSMAVPYKTYENNYSLLLPLKFFSEALGYKVEWDPQKGAKVAGGYIKENANSYYTEETKNAPVKLAAAPKIYNDRIYVPVEYFSQVLKEDVNYNGEAVRFFKVDSEKMNLFNNQIVEFNIPSTAENCVKMYAEAVKMRQGALQYALYSEKLREASKSEFEDLNWVTGVSSPWVTGYDIYTNKDAGKDAYNIIFHWATSAGKSPDSKTIVTVEKVSDDSSRWEITGITE